MCPRTLQGDRKRNGKFRTLFIPMDPRNAVLVKNTSALSAIYPPVLAHNAREIKLGPERFLQPGYIRARVFVGR